MSKSTSKQARAKTYFAISAHQQSPVSEIRLTKKSIGNIVRKHLTASNTNILVGAVGDNKFSVIGKPVEETQTLKAILVKNDIHKIDENAELTITYYFAYCRDGHGRLKKTKTTDPKQAQRSADEHYLLSGGPNGGHYTEVETVIIGKLNSLE